MDLSLVFFFSFLSGKRLRKPQGQLHSIRKLEWWISEALSLFSFLIMKYSLKASVIIRLTFFYLQMIMLFTEVTMLVITISSVFKCQFEF